MNAKIRIPSFGGGIALTLLAAVLFGASTSLAKSLIGTTLPLMLAGLLYLAGGVGLGGWWMMRRLRSHPLREAPITRADLPWLAGAAITSDIVAPVLLMLGLSSTPGATASLLLNLEGIFTVLIA